MSLTDRKNSSSRSRESLDGRTGSAKILCGGLQLLLLLSLIGVLVSLAAMSRLMELAFTLVQPTVIFMLRQSVSFIVFWIVLSLRRTSVVLGKICSGQPSDSGSSIDGPIPNGELKIGTTPICVPYSSRPYESEQLIDIEKNSLPVVRELESSEENVKVISPGSTKSAMMMSANVELAPRASQISFAESRQSSLNFGDQDDRRGEVHSSEDA